jgi:hypothetical protein
MDKDELESLHTDVLRLAARTYAQEALLISFFKHASDKEAILQHYLEQKDTFANRLLYDSTEDVVLDEMNHAHDYLYRVLRTVHPEPEDQ